MPGCGCRAAAKRRKDVTWALDAGLSDGLHSRHADSAAAAVEEERAVRQAAAAWYDGLDNTSLTDSVDIGHVADGCQSMPLFQMRNSRCCWIMMHANASNAMTRLYSQPQTRQASDGIHAFPDIAHMTYHWWAVRSPPYMVFLHHSKPRRSVPDVSNIRHGWPDILLLPCNVLWCASSDFRGRGSNACLQ